jgi:hypothetical protein
MNSSNIITEYAKSSEHICICSTISICLILLFIFSPLNNFLMTSNLAKITILILLIYTLFYNIKFTNNFSNKINISLASGEWNQIKSNLMCSYVFSVVLFVLILSVIRTFFR